LKGIVIHARNYVLNEFQVFHGFGGYFFGGHGVLLFVRRPLCRRSIIQAGGFSLLVYQIAVRVCLGIRFCYNYRVKPRLAFLFLVFLAACFPVPAAVPTPALSVVIVPDTPTPPVTPSPTATRTPEQALYPYTIEALRKRKFQSGEIAIRETLLETRDFTRYLIEYPSDGLTITGILQVPTVGEPPYPVIVMNHGFFSRTVYASGDGTDRAAEFLNKRGYLTASSDYRSWGGLKREKAFFIRGLPLMLST